MKDRLKTITYNAVGIGLYVALSLALNFKVLGNYSLHLGYIVLFVYSYCFSALSGFSVGVIGILLFCLITGSTGSMFGWFFANISLSIILGLLLKLSLKINKKVIEHLYIIFVIVLSSAFSFLIIKPLFETLISGISFYIRVIANIPAFILDTIVLLPAYPIAIRVKDYFN